MTTTELDPWGQPLEPAPVINRRAQQIGAASTIIWNLGGDDAVLCDEIAGRILDTLYPQATTVEEIEALPIGTLIVDDQGNALRRYNRSAYRTSNVWGQPDRFAVTIDRYKSSEEIAGKTWTVVHQVKP